MWRLSGDEALDKCSFFISFLITFDLTFKSHIVGSPQWGSLAFHSLQLNYIGLAGTALCRFHSQKCQNIGPFLFRKIRQSKVQQLLLKYCFTSTETVGLLGTGAQDSHLDFHTAPKLCPTVTAGKLKSPTAVHFSPMWANNPFNFERLRHQGVT